MDNHFSKPTHFSYIVLKLASRCNLNCSYCYWFKDPDVYNQPKKLTRKAQQYFIKRLVSYLDDYPLPEFNIVFHGGEPLLFGKENLDRFCTEIIEATQQYSFDIVFNIISNGVLFDQDWIDLFKKYKMYMTISLDGDQETNDKFRPDFKGHGSYDRIVFGIELLRKNNVNFGVLAVCDPLSNPKKLLHHFVHELNILEFDVLFPEITHDMPYEPIWDYYISLFDDWYDHYSQHNVRIRNLDAIIRLLLGKPTVTDHIGYCPIRTVSINTDGSFGGPDELNLIGSNPNHLNLFEHELKEIFTAPDWIEAYNAKLNLPEKCNQCRYKLECGGGSLPTRFKEDTRFNNVNVYCEDRQLIFDHIANRLVTDLI